MYKKMRLFFLLIVDALLVNVSLVMAAILVQQTGLIFGRVEYGLLAAASTLVYLNSFFFSGLYNRIWEYAGIGEIYAIIRAVTLSCFVIFCLNYYWLEKYLPGSAFVLIWLLSLFLIAGSRFCWRIMSDFYHMRRMDIRKRPALIVGAGGAGVMVARTILENDTGLEPIGFIDDSDFKQNMRLYGLPVLGKREDIPEVVGKYGVEEVIISIPSASSKTIRELVNISRNTPARLKITPSVIEFIDGKIRPGQLRDVQVEDLLHREPVELNLHEITGYLHGRVVLVTGAGGTVGSELCRQVARFGPRLIVLLGRGENSVYETDLSLSDLYPKVDRVLVVSDVRDHRRIESVFSCYRPEVVFHAAAHKHVPIMERSPDEAFSNNVIGTLNMARAADRFESKVFVLISTDKAVNPRSIMGATKRAAEIIVQKINKQSRTKFAAVRFGNVLGSRGSVVPLFKRQIAAGGPVTVTDPEMKRYFMTVPEAVQLVIQAGAISDGGEIFLLDMGEPLKIVDLAMDLIKLSGLSPEKDIPIIFTGARPGEKLFEELVTGGEQIQRTCHERIMVAESRDSLPLLTDEMILELDHRAQYLDKKEALKLLRILVPEFEYTSGPISVEGM